ACTWHMEERRDPVHRVDRVQQEAVHRRWVAAGKDYSETEFRERPRGGDTRWKLPAVCGKAHPRKRRARAARGCFTGSVSTASENSRHGTSVRRSGEGKRHRKRTMAGTVPPRRGDTADESGNVSAFPFPVV